MSESGSTQLPANTRTVIQAAQNKAEQPRTVEITRAPEDLRDVPERTRVRGEVVRNNDDGSVRVRTDRGDVDVRHPKDQNPPREGQPVELEIQPGNPAREATIRNTQAPPQSQQTDSSAQQQRASSTPVNVQVTQVSPASSEAVLIESTTLANIAGTSQSVRLQALSPQEAASIVTASTPQTLTATLTAPITFQAELIALEAQISNQVSVQNIQPLTTQVSTIEVTTPTTTPPQSLNSFQAVQVTSLTTFTPAITQLPTLPPPDSPTFSPPSAARKAISLFGLKGLTVLESGTPASLPPQATLTPPVLQTPQASTLPLTLTSLENIQTTAPLQSLNAQSSLDVRVQTLELPKIEITPPPASKPEAQTVKDAPPIKITENVNAGNIRAVVSGLTAESLPVLSFTLPHSTSAQSFALHIPAPDIPVGSQIQITPQSSAGILTQSIATIAPSIPALITPGEWPLLQDVQQAVAQLSASSAQVISNITPSPANPAQFTPAALFFLSAVRSGDIGGWLGEKTMEILRNNGRSNLLSRLTSESGLLSRLAAEPLSQEWRALPLPLMWDNEMQKVTLFYRREDGGADAEENGHKQTRFIFDLNLSQMGPVQVDGLFREKRLDVILRTEQRFSEHMHMDMRQTYADALRQTEVTGELSFQNNPEQWVKINAEDGSGESFIA